MGRKGGAFWTGSKSVTYIWARVLGSYIGRETRKTCFENSRCSAEK